MMARDTSDPVKILVVSLFLPQKKAYHAGGRFVYEMLKGLSERHEVYLATRVETGEISSLDGLVPFCKKIYPHRYRSFERRNIFNKLFLLISYMSFSRFADRLAREGGFDIVQVEWVETALMMKRRGVPLIIHAHDVISKPAERRLKDTKGAGRLWALLRYRIIKAMELMIVRKADFVFTHSEFDREYLLGMDNGIAKGNVMALPHPAGLDITNRFFVKRKDTMLFLASYKYRMVNVEAALYFYRRIFPLVKKKIPGARFVIAGYGPPEELTSIRDPDVEVTGFVEDIDECYKRASVFVAPILRGGGIIVKILDAMAAGTPVVTTTYGNEGINAESGRDLLVADDEEEFAAGVVNLLTDEELAGRIAQNAGEFVMERFGRNAMMDALEVSYKNLLARTV